MIEVIDMGDRGNPQERRTRAVFKPLTLHNLHMINDVAGTRQVSSDINPLGLWSYNTSNNDKIALIDRNIALEIHDYITDQPFYTFVGQGDVAATARYLLDLAPKKGIAPELRLITKDIALMLTNDPNFNISTDRDNFDYIYDVNQQAALEGREFHGLKNHVNRFKREHPQVESRILSLNNSSDTDQMVALFDQWGQGRKPEDLQHERTALLRTIRDSEYFKGIVTLGLSDPADSNRLIAFIIADIADTSQNLAEAGYAYAHFAKAASKEYNGVYQALYNELAIVLQAKGVRYLNNEQDMGIEGLRRSKMQMNPICLDEKYVVTSNRP